MKEVDYSIIIPVYNSEKTVARCLYSIKALQEMCFEAIVIDDGSTDDTEKICKDIIEEDDRFVFYRKKRSGVSDARNMGIDKARGKYILFADSDDETSYCFDDFKCIENPEIDLVVFGYTLLSSYKKEYLPFKRGKTRLEMKSFKRLLDCSLINSPCNKVYKKDLIPRFPSGVEIGEDFIFNIRYLRNCHVIYLLDKSEYIYYQNPGSAMHRPDKITADDAIKMIHALCGFLDNRYGYERKNAGYILGDFSAKKALTDLTSIVNSDSQNVRDIFKYLSRWKKKILSDDIFRKCLKMTILGRACYAVIRTNIVFMYIFTKVVIKLKMIKNKNGGYQ